MQKSRSTGPRKMANPEGHVVLGEEEARAALRHVTRHWRRSCSDAFMQ